MSKRHLKFKGKPGRKRGVEYKSPSLHGDQMLQYGNAERLYREAKERELQTKVGTIGKVKKIFKDLIHA